MKRLISTWVLCSALSAASFGVLMIEDRRLGVALPFSLPIAFFSLAALAPGLVALVEWLRQRRPVVIQLAPAPQTARDATDTAVDDPAETARPACAAQGVVLLDWSTFRSRERAA